MTAKKIMISGHRGTEVHEAEIGEQNWAGDAYRKVELEKLEKIPKGLILNFGRGVRTTTFRRDARTTTKTIH